MPMPPWIKTSKKMEFKSSVDKFCTKCNISTYSNLFKNKEFVGCYCHHIIIRYNHYGNNLFCVYQTFNDIKYFLVLNIDIFFKHFHNPYLNSSDTVHNIVGYNNNLSIQDILDNGINIKFTSDDWKDYVLHFNPHEVYNCDTNIEYYAPTETYDSNIYTYKFPDIKIYDE